MKKLKLELDELCIESFDTIVPQKALGTIRGEQATDPNLTCGPTCNASCYHSCVAYISCEQWTPCGTCDYDTCNCVRSDFC